MARILALVLEGGRKMRERDVRGKYQVLVVRVTNRVMVVAEGEKEVLVPLLLGETKKYRQEITSYDA